MKKQNLIKLLGLIGIIIIIAGFLLMIFAREMLIFWICVVIALIVLFIVKKLKKSL